jgi:hypothetical protein
MISLPVLPGGFFVGVIWHFTGGYPLPGDFYANAFQTFHN